MDLNQDLLRPAMDGAQRAAGGMLAGIAHNLNNPTHALAMQAELFLGALKKGPGQADVERLLEKCTRLQHISEDLRAQIDVLTWRAAYVNTSMELVDPLHFGTWFLQFWRNNLFFKHNMTVDMVADPPPPHVLAVPLALLWSLEGPLQAMTDLYGQSPSEVEFGMRFHIQGIDEHGVDFKVLIAPASQDLAFALPPLKHEQGIRSLTEALGWKWEYACQDNMLSLRLTIPGPLRNKTPRLIQET